jgi:hypothetical protein
LGFFATGSGTKFENSNIRVNSWHE